MDEIKRDLQNPSKATHEDLFGKGITYICIGFVSLLVISILYFITTRGLATFTVNHVSLWKFLSGTTWNPSLLDKHGNPGHTIRPNYWSLGVSMIAAIIISILAKYNSLKGQQLKNQALTASGQDLKSDAWTSFGTFLSIGGAYLGAQWLDGVATLLVGCLILHASISIFRTTIMRLTEGFDPKNIDRYSKTISTIPVLGRQSVLSKLHGWHLGYQMSIR